MGRLLCALLFLAALTAADASAPALPALVARASDSLSALLRPQLPAADGKPAAAGSPAPAGPSPLLAAMQTQAQRQLGQLNGLVMSGAAQLSNSSSGQYGNVLEVLSSVGKAIQQQMGASPQVQIVTSELASNKKHEYQAISPQPGQQVAEQAPNATSTQYREQGELLRQDIVRRVGQLQQVVASSLDVLKNNGDLIVRRLLEQLNGRLDQAKSKADKIINEQPATNEVAIKALYAINQGLNNLNNIITNIVNRLELGVKESNAALAQRAGGNTAGPGPHLLDPSRFKINFHQLGQQFSSALNAVQQQQRNSQPQQQLQPQQPQQNVATGAQRV